MKFNPTLLGLIAIFLDRGSAAPTWPAATDELEDVMFLNSGYKSRGFGSHVTPCGFSEFGAGRNTAAEFLRLGFHDMANANTFREPRGGIDASIAFELGNGDNIGTGFASSLGIYGTYLNSRLSVADMIALGVYSSVRSCGGPAVPMRGGRTDTDVAGPIGVPQPADGTTVFKSRFVRTGFDTTEMIKLVACGHTLGGVHSANFPDIVPAGSAPDGYALFDTTLDFDTKIVTRYLDGPDTDPLSTGPVVGKRADLAVFVADNNATMKTLRDAATFNSACSTVLQKMIELVPTAVVLSDIIVPYDVKPSGLQLTLLSGGNQIQFSGNIRVRTTSGAASSVQIVYKDRNGGAGGTITTTPAGTASGFDDTFSFFSFSSNLAASTSISSFTVVVSGAGGATQTYDNNGNGFPVQDSVIVQTPQSCLSGGSLTVVAAVRTGVDAPALSISQRVARSDASIPIPQLVANTVQMTAGATVGAYTLYSGTFSVASGPATTYDVSSGTFADAFKNAGDLGATCATLGGGSSSSSSSSTTTTTTSQTSTTSSSATPTGTLARKPIVGAYSFQGCWTEIPGGRVLNEASFYDYTGMTLEACATNCAAYTWFGVEYGGECYCGNTLNPASTLAAVADCYFVCPGDQYEFCGAGNRLELYKKTSSISSSSSSSTLPTSTTLSTTVRSTTSSTAVPTLHIVPSVGLYNYYGCWSESPGVRTLPSDFLPSDSLTIEMCVDYCSGSGYKFAGAEYGRECWCANELSPGSELKPDSDCNFYCPGDVYEYCGAGNRLTMYIKNGTIDSGPSSSSTTTTTSSTTTSKSSSTPSTVSTTTTQSSTTTTKPSTTTTSSTTTSKPSTTTSSTTTTKPSTTTTTSKTTTTTSKTTTTTSKTTTTTSKTTTTTSKTTTTTSKTTTTTSKTTTTTSKAATTTSKTTSKSSTTTSKTTTKPTTTTSKTTSKTTTKTTTTTRVGKSLAQETPVIKPTIGEYKYLGCRTETGTYVRALSGLSYFDDEMTLEICATRCRGYKYWGAEYGRECYCGNVFNSGSVEAPGGDADCYFECPGDNLEWCGAGDRLSVYELE